jgi:hypothetical protein
MKKLFNLDKKRDRWIKQNRSVLATACANALGLYQDTARARVDLLHISIAIRSEYFELLDANVISFAEARRIRTEGNHWEQCVSIFESGCRRFGDMAAIAIDLFPLPVYFLQLQFGSMYGVPLSQDWKASLRKAIHDRQQPNSRASSGMLTSLPLKLF